MLTPTTRNILIVGAFVAIGGLAVAGWMRKNDRPVDFQAAPSAASYPAPVAGQYSAAGQYSNPGQYPATGQYAATGQYTGPQTGYQTGYGNAPVPQPVYASDGYYPTRMRPVYIRQPEEVQVVQTAPRRVYEQQEYYTDSRGHRRGRTKTHSVEIVAGTAAVGAVIGGLAGGGKGAAIGAISGGGAGFVYDRLTHNH